MAERVQMNPRTESTGTDRMGETERHTSSTSHPLQRFENSTLVGNEDTHPRLTPLILVEPYGKPNVGSRFSIVDFEGVACAVHVWAKRSTAAAAASMVRRDMGLDAGGGKEKRGGNQWHNPFAALSLLGWGQAT